MSRRMRGSAEATEVDVGVWVNHGYLGGSISVSLGFSTSFYTN